MTDPTRYPLRVVLLVSGWLCVGLGLIGVLLPLLPTTPFMILASICFARSSPRCHRWLLSRPHLGPAIQDWEREGAIRTRAKVLAILVLVLVIGATAVFAPVTLAVRLSVVGVGVAVAAFIYSRPVPGKLQTSEDEVSKPDAPLPEE